MATGMKRLLKHLRIGRRWLLNGWRLFLRNPWLLGGMGLSASVVLGAFHLIPLFGGLLIALAAPVMLASAYLSLDLIYRHNRILPAELRLTALKQSPRQLLAVFRNDEHILPAAVASAVILVAVLLIHLLARMVAGEVWVTSWLNVDRPTLFGLLAMALLIFTFYILLAASLIYALPLTFLRDEPLVPALHLSLKASRHFTVALLVLLGVLLVPFLLGALVGVSSRWGGYLLWTVSGAVVLPVVASGLYCSYRDIFTLQDRRIAVVRRRRADDQEDRVTLEPRHAGHGA